jgi:hypothetical protein
MHRLRSALVAALLFAPICPPAAAGTTVGEIVQYATFEVPGNPPLFYVWISGTAANPAACGTETAGSNKWATRLDTAAGRGHMAAIFMAKMLGRTVQIEGKGQYTPGSGNPCDGWFNTESIYYISVGP